MNRKSHILQFLFLLPFFAFAANDAYLVEAKVQSDLENAISRIISKEQFLIQVNADIQIKSERRLVEGETLQAQTQSEIKKENEVAPPLPGFVPEFKEEVVVKENPSVQSRQVYRTVETSELNTLKIYVKFDNTLPQKVVAQAKTLIQDYLRGSYPNKSYVSFAQIAMLKPEKPVGKTDTEKALEKLQLSVEKMKEKTPPSLMEQVWLYMRWVGAALLGAIAMMLLIQRENQNNGKQDTSMQNLLPFLTARNASENSTHQIGGPRRSSSSRPRLERGPSVREQLLDKFLARSESFKNYYSLLNVELRNEISFGLAGPAFDSLLDGLAIPRAPQSPEIPEIELKLSRHEKNFDEFVRTQDWKSSQFFGFLQFLTDEQLGAIVSLQSHQVVATMLRFMLPQQSAKVLKPLSDSEKTQVLSYSSKLNQVPYAELLEIERQVRQLANQLPKNIFGSQKDEADFWGKILNVTDDQESLLKMLERDKPELYPTLKKFRFTLEDAATLPNAMLEKVLSSMDNEELCLALATCSPNVSEVILDAVPAKRRDYLVNQLEGYRDADSEKTNAAKIVLTKKIREAIS